MLDFDDGKTTKEELFEKQKSWKYNSVIFSSQNHQKEKYKKDGSIIPPCDRLRVFIPFKEPLTSEFDRQAVESWFKINYPTIDKTFMGKSRYFAHGTVDVWSFENKQNCLDWSKLKKLYDQDFLNDTYYINLDDKIRDDKGRHVCFLDIEKGSSIFCPVCGDEEYRNNTGQHNAVKFINKKGLPFIHCASCKSRSMGYKKSGNYYLHPNDSFQIKSEENNAVVFIDTLKCRMYSGCVENGSDNYIIRDISSEYHAKQFCEYHELPIPKHFPRARYELLFDKNDRINFDKGYVNMYAPTKYLVSPAVNGFNSGMPKYIGKVIDHVFAHDREIIDHFINDLADFVQTRSKRRTAFLCQGTEGTGKGFLFTVVLKNILGNDYCSQTDMHAFSGKFNSFLENNVYVLVNEVSGNFSSPSDNLSTIEKIKIAITDDHIQIEGKGKDRYNGRNNCSFLFASNRDNALVIPMDDRRFNVAPKQTVKIHDTDWWEGDDLMVKTVESELQDFVWYLMGYKIDKSKINRVIDNEPKRVLQTLSMNNAELFFNALKSGDYQWLLDNFREEVPGYIQDTDTETAKQVLKYLGMPNKGSDVIIKSGDLCVLYNHMNQKQLTSIGFGKLAPSHLGEAKPHDVQGKKIHGFKLKFRYPTNHVQPALDDKTENRTKNDLFD